MSVHSLLMVNNILLYGYTHFVHLLINWWEFGLFVWGMAIMKNDAINVVNVYVSDMNF